MSPETTPQITYWYFPEGEKLFIDDPSINMVRDPDNCVQLTEYEFVRRKIEAIDADPEHKLPDNIDAVIKLAANWPGDSISGQIWYDRHQRFINDYPVNTSKIVAREPGGIYCTANHKYLVELIQAMGTNGNG